VFSYACNSEDKLPGHARANVTKNGVFFIALWPYTHLS